MALMTTTEHLQSGRRARELGDLMGLRLEALVSMRAKQLATRSDGRSEKLPRSRWRPLRRDRHHPERSEVSTGSLLVCLASDAGERRPAPPRVAEPRAPEPGLCVIRALILEGHGLQRTTKMRSQWASINLSCGATTVSTRRIELKSDGSAQNDTGTAHAQWDELLELVIDCPKDQDGFLVLPDAFLELMLGGEHGSQKRLSYTRIPASELTQGDPQCMVQDSLSKDLYKDKVLGSSFVPWADYALGVLCVDATSLKETDRLSDSDYYVRVTLYSGPESEIPSPDHIRQEKPSKNLTYSQPSRTCDVEVNDENVAAWGELFRFGTPHDEGHYEMPPAKFLIVDVFDEDIGRDDHVGRSQIKIRYTNHGYEVDHIESGVAQTPRFRPIEDNKEEGWPLFVHQSRLSSRHQEGSIRLEFSQHAFVPRSTWRKDPALVYEIRVHVFSALDLPVQDRDEVNEVFLRASMDSSPGKTMDGKAKTKVKTRTGPGPIWNQTLQFDSIRLPPAEYLEAGLAPQLEMSLFDRDTGSVPDFLARCAISATDIIDASERMTAYVAGETGHPAKWHELFEQDYAVRAGKVLLAFEICKKSDAPEKAWLDSTFPEAQRKAGKCTPPVRKCRLEMLVVGCRGLTSWMGSKPTSPFVGLSMSNKSGGVGKSASTLRA